MPYGLIESFLGSSEWISILFIFLALPVFLIYMTIEVHKEYAEAVRFCADKKILNKKNIQEGFRSFESALYIFELDWWMIASTAILMLMITSLPYLLYVEGRASPVCAVSSKATANPEVVKSALECAMYVNVLRLYCLMCGVAIAFRIGWARVAAVKNLRAFYLQCAALNE